MSKISVVIPLYNKAAYVKRAIDSVLSQTFQDFELIVVNDGSTDGGEKIIQRLTDRRISLYSRNKPSPGGHAARNLGIQKAVSELIAFLDADDEWTPAFIETVLSLREKYPAAGAYGTAYLEKDINKTKAPKLWGVPHDENWQGIIPDYFKSALYGASPFCTISVAIPKKVFRDVGFFPEGVGRGGDHDMWVRIALKYNIAFSPKIGAVYHKYIPGSVVKTNKALYGYKAVETIENFFAQNKDMPNFRRRWIAEYADKKRLGAASQCIKAGKVKLAKVHLNSCQTKKFIMKKAKLNFCILLSTMKSKKQDLGISSD